MKTDVDQAALSDNANRPVNESPLRARRIAYKAVLAAVVIGIVTILALWVLTILQNDSPDAVAEANEPVSQAKDESESKDAHLARREDQHARVGQQGDNGPAQTISLLT